MASIAITGARGRLGSHLLANPAWGEGHQLTGYSREEDKSLRSLDALANPGAASKYDFILHLAWSTVPRTAEESPGRPDAIDLPLLRRILDSVERAGERRGRPVHLVFFSTGAVYGNSLRDGGSIETDPPRPIGEYARGKLAAEDLIDRYSRDRGVSATILRVSNAWGFPGRPGSPQGVIPRLIRCSLDHEVFQRWGSDAEKDYLHIDDLSRALRSVFEAPPPGLYNVATGRSHRLSEVMEIVETVTGHPIECAEGGSDLPWDVQQNRLSPARFSEVTGWRAEVDLEEGVDRLARELESGTTGHRP